MTPDVGSSHLLEIALWALWVTAVLRNTKQQNKCSARRAAAASRSIFSACSVQQMESFVNEKQEQNC
jgi:hypothetical protein